MLQDKHAASKIDKKVVFNIHEEESDEIQGDGEE
jgi:hypothetical protein